MTDDLRTLLTEVAAGRVDPAEAARRLDEIPADAASEGAPAEAAEPATGEPDAATRPPSPTSGSDETVTLVRVQSSARPVRIVADPSVATLSVEGPHSVRRAGSTLTVQAPPDEGPDAAGSYRYERKTGLSRWIAQASMMGVPITVRVHPDLAVDVELMAGSLDVSGLRGAFDFSVTAGSLRASDCTGTIRGSIRAGSAKIDARPTSGESSVRVESGSVVLRLQRGSDVRLRARSELGEVKVDGAKKGDGTQEIVLGAGTATFDLDVAMGSAKVSTT